MSSFLLVNSFESTSLLLVTYWMYGPDIFCVMNSKLSLTSLKESNCPLTIKGKGAGGADEDEGEAEGEVAKTDEKGEVEAGETDEEEAGETDEVDARDPLMTLLRSMFSSGSFTSTSGEIITLVFCDSGEVAILVFELFVGVVVLLPFLGVCFLFGVVVALFCFPFRGVLALVGVFGGFAWVDLRAREDERTGFLSVESFS